VNHFILSLRFRGDLTALKDKSPGARVDITSSIESQPFAPQQHARRLNNQIERSVIEGTEPDASIFDALSDERSLMGEISVIDDGEDRRPRNSNSRPYLIGFPASGSGALSRRSKRASALYERANRFADQGTR
jgi:hypothetical protein